jgi:hypothetical protein
MYRTLVVAVLTIGMLEQPANAQNVAPTPNGTADRPSRSHENETLTNTYFTFGQESPPTPLPATGTPFDVDSPVTVKCQNKAGYTFLGNLNVGLFVGGGGIFEVCFVIDGSPVLDCPVTGGSPTTSPNVQMGVTYLQPVNFGLHTVQTTISTNAPDALLLNYNNIYQVWEP